MDSGKETASPRAFKDELNSQIWFSPLIYALFSVLLAALTLFLDYYCKVGEKVPSFFSINMDLTEYVSEYDYARNSIDYDVYL